MAPEDDPLDENMDIRLEIVRLANEERKKAGVPALSVNDALMDAAQDCSEQGFTKHDSKYECEAALKYGYTHGIGANLAMFTCSSSTNIAKFAVENWTYSPGHYKTMVDPAGDAIGVGVTIRDGKAYCYMLVGDSTSFNPYA